MTKVPQLRMLVTDYCDSNCVYCRPGGEGNLNSHHLSMDYNIAIKVAAAYKHIGGNCIKITGGDPVFWKFLTNYVTFLKKELYYECVELITRSPKIYDCVDDLKQIGLDIINFSFDTVNKDKYSQITSRHDIELIKKVIIETAKKIYCKINMVILHDTSESEVDDMLDFCVSNGIRELKLLDFINDLNGNNNSPSQKDQFELIYQKLGALTSNLNVVSQGELGHPMKTYNISDSFKVTCKDAHQGAWYGEPCLKCPHYPCHDALMALRVTPQNSFQLCLLNNKMHWNFDSLNLEKQLIDVMKIYQNAFFRK